MLRWPVVFHAGGGKTVRLIVSIYRFLIGLFFVLALGVAAYLFTTGIFRGSAVDFLSMAAGLSMFVIIVIAIGATATFISIHDRLCELVDLLSDRFPNDRSIDA
jgi:hypothetical protein